MQAVDIALVTTGGSTLVSCLAAGSLPNEAYPSESMAAVNVGVVIGPPGRCNVWRTREQFRIRERSIRRNPISTDLLESGMPAYQCHGCGESFSATVENGYGTYEFRECPRCGSRKTTLR